MKKILLLLLVMASILSVNATEYYVSPTGSNTNNGTSLATAFSTIQKAHDVSLPGDVINVADGNYANTDVKITRSGSSSAYITYKAINKWGPKISNYWGDVFRVEANYITIDGFNVKTTGIFGSGISVFKSDASTNWHHVKVLNNYAHDCGQSGVQSYDNDYVYIIGNVTERNGWLMPDAGSGISIYGGFMFDNDPGYHFIVKDNISFLNDNGPTTLKTDGNGIIIDDQRNTQVYHSGLAKKGTYSGKILVENNICYGNGGKGIHTFSTTNVTIRNNTVYGNNTRNDAPENGWWRGELSCVYSQNISYINNIAVTKSGTGVFSFNAAIFTAGADLSNITYYNNITYDVAKPTDNSIKSSDMIITLAIAGVNGNKCAVDPLFTNPGANFHLKATSPAINAGTGNYGLSALDLDGFARVQGSAVDIGCYETSATNVPITGISFTPSVLSLPKGLTAQLLTTIIPANATNQIVTFSSSNTAVATVNSLGVVTGVETGTATITVTSQDGNKIATCAVTVSLANTISIASAPESVTPTGTYTVNLNYSAGQAGIVKVMIISSAPNYAWLGEGSITVSANQTGNNVAIPVTITTPMPIGANYTWNVQLVDANNISMASTSANFQVADTNVAVTGIAVNPTTSSISVGNTTQLIATIAPANATNKSVSWASSNTAVATVDTSGLVTAVAAGSATITVTTIDGSIVATCAITVTGAAASDLTIQAESYCASAGITTYGTITGEWSNGDYTKYCAVNLGSGYSTLKMALGSLQSGSYTIRSGSVTGTLLGTINFTPTGGWDTYQEFTCTLTGASGILDIYVVGGGIANFDYMKFTGGASSIAVTGVTVTPASVSLAVGATTTLAATVAPANATNKSVSWASSNTSVATVNASGLVTAVATGSATITVTTVDGAKVATCAVTVTAAASDLTIQAESYCASAGITTYGTITGEWSSGDYTKYCTVNLGSGYSTLKMALASLQSGSYAIRSGSTTGTLLGTINFTSTGGWETYQEFTCPLTGASGILDIYVVGGGVANFDYMKFTSGASSIAVTGVTVIPASVSLAVGATTTLAATVAPANATIKSVSWASSNTSVATVNASGLVTAVAAGSAIITVTTIDGAKAATCAVTVTAATAPDLTIQAESFCTQSGLSTWPTGIGGFGNGLYAKYCAVNLSTGYTKLVFNYATTGSGIIYVKTGSPTGTTIGTLNFTASAGWDTFKQQTIDLTAATGIQDVYLVGGTFTVNLDWIKFTNNPPALGRNGGIRNNQTIALTELALNNSVLIYPNPVSRRGVLNLKNAVNEMNHIAITDVLGRVRYVKSFRGSLQFNIAEARLSPGVYFLISKKEKGQKTYRFVVE